jgi:hypothetical protein
VSGEEERELARPPDLSGIALLTVEPVANQRSSFFAEEIQHEARYYGRPPRDRGASATPLGISTK